ncbi:SIR2 family protein [Micromonospora rifamycinica]|uniref:SIR2 family protein n=1 Tax=Micromonospora rifamycinica TaxID=291594 RepID=UPI0033E8185F
MPAQDSVRELVRHLRQFRGDEPSAEKPFFWLGAGCSVHDGVPLNAELLDAVLGDDVDTWGSRQYRFDLLCDRLGPGAARAGLFRRHLERPLTPDSPYRRLVGLLAQGYADMVVTVNIDDLLERALVAAGLREHHDYRLIDVPQYRPEAAVLRITAPGGPRIRIIKLHGGLDLGLNLMTSREIIQYEEGIEQLVRDVSSRPAVVCGYSFFHLNVLQAFSRNRSPLYYANITFPEAPMVLSLMAQRNHTPRFIDGTLGNFTGLMRTVTEQLT